MEVEQETSGDLGDDVHSQEEVMGLLLQQTESIEEGNEVLMTSDMVEGIPNTDEESVAEAQEVQVISPIGESEVSLLGASEIQGQVMTLTDGQQLQAVSVTLEDGKMFEGQTVQLEDGTTAIVQNVMSKVKDEEAESVEAADCDQLPKLVEGQAIQLEDGTIAYIQSTTKEGLQAVQLEDGTTAYITTTGGQGLFTDGTQLASAQLTLEQLNQQAALAAASEVKVRLGGERTMSMSEKAFRCLYEGCGRLYTTQHHLKVHERSHTGDRPFKCKQEGCGKAFATGYGLKSHTRVHTGEKPYRCPEEACEKAFKTSGDLQKHVRTHTGERPFKCPFEGCERSFTTSNIRKVHIRTHTGERPYICDEDGCNKAFASATNYKNHIRIHTGEKPYVCTVEDCGKRFTEYSSLYKHHVVHTHSKPYVCHHCGKNYRQTSTLAMHKRTAHGDDTAVDAEAALLMPSSIMQTSDLASLQSAMPGAGATCLYNKRVQVQLPVEKMDEDEGALVINTQEMADGGVISGFTQEAAQATLQQLTAGHGITLADGDGQQHIYVVTDPAQLEALQQLAQQQLFAQAVDDGTVVTSDVTGTTVTSNVT